MTDKKTVKNSFSEISAANPRPKEAKTALATFFIIIGWITVIIPLALLIDSGGRSYGGYSSIDSATLYTHIYISLSGLLMVLLGQIAKAVLIAARSIENIESILSGNVEAGTKGDKGNLDPDKQDHQQHHC